jgi:hypothetical protein
MGKAVVPVLTKTMQGNLQFAPPKRKAQIVLVILENMHITPQLK